MTNTIELIQALNIEQIEVSHSNDEIGNSHYEYSFELHQLEAFRKEVEKELLDGLQEEYARDGDGYCSQLEDVAEELDIGDTVELYTWRATKAKFIKYEKAEDGNLYVKETK